MSAGRRQDKQRRQQSRRPRPAHEAAERAQRRPSPPKADPFTRGGRVTLYGRKPVLEALQDPSVLPQKLFLAHRAEGSIIREITQLARDVGLPIERMSAMELSRISKQGKQDQGVALDVQAPHHRPLSEALSELKAQLEQGELRRPIFLLDGLQTPANLGMTLRSLCGAGVTGVILPRRGCAPLNPLAVKASAGVALKAPLWSCETALEAAQALSELGLTLYGLRGSRARCLFTELTALKGGQGVWVLGNESEGVSAEVGGFISEWASIPMEGGVESLNAAVAASVVSFELARRRVCEPPL